MKLSDFVVREAILTDLKASSKEAAIRELHTDWSEEQLITEMIRLGIVQPVIE